MTTLRYTGEAGQIRHNDRPLAPGDSIEVPDDDVAGYLAIGLFEAAPTDAPEGE